MKLLRNKSKIVKIVNSRIAYHVYFWIFLLSILLLEPTGEEVAYWYRLRYSFCAIGTAFFPVYSHFYIFEKYFFRKRYGIYTLLLPVIISVSGIFSKAVFTRFSNTETSITAALFFVLLMIILTTGLKLAKAGFRQRLMFQKIKAKQLQTELSLLKSQINPHFLFNTLNNLFSMARKQKDQSTANGIAKLSHLMRYMIYESNVDKIDLQKEINQINSFIELQKLRFSEDDDIRIDFTIEGELTGRLIPPMDLSIQIRPELQ